MYQNVAMQYFVQWLIIVYSLGLGLKFCEHLQDAEWMKVSYFVSVQYFIEFYFL